MIVCGETEDAMSAPYEYPPMINSDTASLPGLCNSQSITSFISSISVCPDHDALRRLKLKVMTKKPSDSRSVAIEHMTWLL